jgi:hypothetical protein
MDFVQITQYLERLLQPSGTVLPHDKKIGLVKIKMGKT